MIQEIIKSRAGVIEGRILAEKRKHPTLDWIKIASIKISKDIQELLIEKWTETKNKQYEGKR